MECFILTWNLSIVEILEKPAKVLIFWLTNFVLLNCWTCKIVENPAIVEYFWRTPLLGGSTVISLKGSASKFNKNWIKKVLKYDVSVFILSHWKCQVELNSRFVFSTVEWKWARVCETEICKHRQQCAEWNVFSKLR